MSSQDTDRQRRYASSSFRPREGEVVCQVNVINPLEGLISEVSVPVKGKWFVKAGGHSWFRLEIVGFRPREGEVVCQDFSF